MFKKEKLYRIEYSNEFATLENKVDEAIRQGYAVIGAPALTASGKEIVVCQALVKISKIAKINSFPSKS